MTKSRHSLSPEYALLRTLAILTPQGAAEVSGYSEAYLRACSDPDNKREINFETTVALDVACKAENGETPFFDVFRDTLEATATKHAENIHAALLDIYEDAGKLSAKVREAMDSSSPGGTAFTEDERAKCRLLGKGLIAEISVLVSSLEK